MLSAVWLRNVAGPNTARVGSSSAIRSQVSLTGCCPCLCLAREASLEPEEDAEVLGQQQVLELAAHEDDHGVVPEALVEALGRVEGLGVAIDEAVRGRLGVRAASPQPLRGA